jgi:Family of unknown function (DUF6314)
MFGLLFGTKNVQKVLLFLFVNGKCYGTQLQKLLKTPLTPIQKALLRLEKGGIVISHYEGKTRVYQFNPAFPLLAELEQLLKKAYTLLPSDEKKSYCSIKPSTHKKDLKQQESEQLLITYWERLYKVKSLTFNARSKSKEEGRWNGHGAGEVIVTQEGDNVLFFQEKGSWTTDTGREIDFSNTFRWTLDRKACLLSLEHLRRGVNHPVFLFYLAPAGDRTLRSVDSHLCEQDAYFGHIACDLHSLRLNWRVIGPKKNEEIDYYYT